MQIKNTLRPYQKDGVQKLIELTTRRNAAILADEPGLGKTIQVAEFINKTNPDTVLIVCPASLRVNWDKELTKWILNHRHHYIRLASYEEVARNIGSFDRFDLVVFDEAHYLKNPTAKRTKHCLSLAAGKRLFLTGTPIVNRPMDMFPILKSIGLKMSKTEFGKRFCAGKLVQIRWKPRKFAWDFSGASNQKELAEALRRDIMVRRRKADVLTQLPAKIRQVIDMAIDLDEPKPLCEAWERYYDGLDAAADNISELKQIAFEELSAARLDIARAKLPYVIDYVKNTLEEEEKVVIFAHHREIADALQEAFAAEYGAVKLQGGMTDKAKDKAVRAFQDGDSRVFVGQIQAAGTGITLTAAKTVVFAELDWVPGNMIQAEDRCHRMGQTDTVRVIHITATDSVDSRLIHALVEKQATIDEVIQ